MSARYRACTMCRHRRGRRCAKALMRPITFEGDALFPALCPLEVCGLCKGKGMDSWGEPFSQTTAAVCPDCLGHGRKE